MGIKNEIDYINDMIKIADTIPTDEAPHQLKKAEISVLMLIAEKLDSNKLNINEALDFVVQYLYSEHQICDPKDDAAPYTPDELKRMAIKILSNR